MNSKYLIECISAGKQYSRKGHSFTALSDINLAISENETLLVRGRSGAGKSTLIHLMCGLIKPSSGKLFFKGISLGDSDNQTLSSILLNEAGIIFQNFNLLPAYTVFENIEIGILPMKNGSLKEKYRIREYLEKFDLAEKANLLPSELSIGQQQKVAIIRTLIREPSVIFADEPTGSVDDQSASEILSLLDKIRKERNVTLILATHGNIPDSFADRVVELENGRLKS
jgi:putative ABC transport system ATP-binding protein